jgi:hypothetical protein
VINAYDEIVGGSMARLELASRRDRQSYNINGLSMFHRVSNSLGRYKSEKSGYQNELMPSHVRAPLRVKQSRPTYKA